MKDETVQAFQQLDDEEQAAETYSRENTNEGMPVYRILQLRRAFLAGARWQQERFIQSETIGKHRQSGKHGEEL